MRVLKQVSEILPHLRSGVSEPAGLNAFKGRGLFVFHDQQVLVQTTMELGQVAQKLSPGERSEEPGRPGRRDLLLGIEAEAGRIRARSMDGLLLVESYSWVLINKALTYIKAQVKTAKTDVNREEVLALWDPFLSLVSRELEQMNGHIDA